MHDYLRDTAFYPRDQSNQHQRLQDMPPAGSFARVRQALCPEPVELQLLVEMTRKPAPHCRGRRNSMASIRTCSP
jgi:hypothetical protein